MMMNNDDIYIYIVYSLAQDKGRSADNLCTAWHKIRAGVQATCVQRGTR